MHFSRIFGGRLLRWLAAIAIAFGVINTYVVFWGTVEKFEVVSTGTRVVTSPRGPDEIGSATLAELRVVERESAVALHGNGVGIECHMFSVRMRVGPSVGVKVASIGLPFKMLWSVDESNDNGAIVRSSGWVLPSQCGAMPGGGAIYRVIPHRIIVPGLFGNVVSVVLLCMFAAWGHQLFLGWRQRRARISCSQCGYDTCGLAGNICPECGSDVPAKS